MFITHQKLFVIPSYLEFCRNNVYNGEYNDQKKEPTPKQSTQIECFFVFLLKIRGMKQSCNIIKFSWLSFCFFNFNVFD